MSEFPVVLSIAGSDNSAGAGIQADLKTFSAMGVYGVTAVTCVVAEVPGKVSLIQPLSPAIVAEQIRLVFEAFPIGALKTGMLHSQGLIECVCAALREEFARLPAGAQHPALVVDPVMVATSGHALLEAAGVRAYQEQLFALATLVTPNLDEVCTLIGRPVSTLAQMRAAGDELVARYNTAFLLKGGHLRGQEAAVDLLFFEGQVFEYSAPFIAGVSTHGTGCTYSAAIVAGLGRGLLLQQAVAEAKQFVSGAISGFLRWQRAGGATDALDHFAATRRG